LGTLALSVERQSAQKSKLKMVG